jgi:hypothetical protein
MPLKNQSLTESEIPAFAGMTSFVEVSKNGSKPAWILRNAFWIPRKHSALAQIHHAPLAQRSKRSVKLSRNL